MLFKPPVKFNEVCVAGGLSPIEFNNLWLLDKKNADGEPTIHTLVIGTARPSDFDEHMKSIGKYDQRAELVPPIEAKLNAMYEEAMGKDWVAGWWKGLPDPFGNVDGKPVDGSLVNVPANPHVVHYGVIAWLYSICKAWDFHDFARQRYGMLVGNGKKLDSTVADGKTSSDYVLDIMGDFGPGCDTRTLDSATLAASIEGAPCKDAVLAALEWARENLHPVSRTTLAGIWLRLPHIPKKDPNFGGQDKECEIPPMCEDMRPDICWPDRPKPKSDAFDWGGYITGKLRLLCGLIGAAEEAGEVDGTALGSFFTEGASVSLGDGDLAKFVADGNIDLAIKSGGVKAKVRPLTLSPPLTFCRRGSQEYHSRGVRCDVCRVTTGWRTRVRSSMRTRTCARSCGRAPTPPPGRRAPPTGSSIPSA